ncbi:MAG: hypothetical protein CMA07_05645 [Euryarchaeota archaeon]|nr:hypothetical protein [Euryarchaeota archaeon]
MSRKENSLCGVVQRHAKKSLKRVKATSQEILSQILASPSSEVHPLYEQFLKGLESHKDRQEKTKD